MAATQKHRLWFITHNLEKNSIATASRLEPTLYPLLEKRLITLDPTSGNSTKRNTRNKQLPRVTLCGSEPKYKPSPAIASPLPTWRLTPLCYAPAIIDEISPTSSAAFSFVEAWEAAEEENPTDPPPDDPQEQESVSASTDRPTKDPLGLTVVTAHTDQPIGDPQDTRHTDNPTDDPISDPIGPLTSTPSLDPSACPDGDSSDPMTSEITTPKSPFKPPDPKMGGLMQVKHDAYSAWTGGKRKADWSKLEETSPEYEQTTQLRPMINDSGFSKCCKGFEDKFSKNGDLYKFQRRLIDHLKIMGMDTITYLPDPADNDPMANVIMDHTWFTQAYVRSAAPIQYAKYDNYDQSNDRAARLMFVDSLNETLKGEIQDRIPDEPSFLEVWMLFIQTLQSDSMERIKDMEKDVRSLQPQQFSGQNIAEMCLSIVKRWKGLTAAGV